MVNWHCITTTAMEKQCECGYAYGNNVRNTPISCASPKRLTWFYRQQRPPVRFDQVSTQIPYAAKSVRVWHQTDPSRRSLFATYIQPKSCHNTSRTLSRQSPYGRQHATAAAISQQCWEPADDGSARLWIVILDQLGFSCFRGIGGHGVRM
jgi:hypothetical protein